MRTNAKGLAVLFAVVALIGSIFLLRSCSNNNKGQQGASIEERQQFKKDLAAIDTYHDYLDKGERYAKSGQIVQAEKEYFKALKMAKTADGEVVARGKLARFYESIGANEKALEEVEWFLKRNLTEPGRIKYSEAKERLIKKMQTSSGSASTP